MNPRIKRNNNDGTRICYQCNENIAISNFCKSSRKWDGYEERCKNCKKLNLAKKKQKNPDMYKEYYVKKKDSILARNKVYQDNNRDLLRNISKNKRQENPESLRAYARDYYRKNKERILKNQKAWTEKKRAAGGFDLKDGELSKWCRRGDVNRKQKKERYAELIKDPLFRLKHKLRGRVTTAFTKRGWEKSNELQKIVGADFDFVKKYIERQFQKGMCWENYGDWHIDHIIPLSSANTEEELIILCHYTNLQPLWAYDNLSKGAKIPQVQMKIAI